jgi:protein-L-isoaspartate(D-aspartate) O-methyltransferase
MDFEVARAGLIHQLDAEIEDKRVLSAMSRVPRHLFIPPELAHSAYDNIPLPIGLNQTISQPYIVALMTEKLELTPDKKVLELGTGSGYQTAILAELARQVVTTERLPELLDKAKLVLAQLGYNNIEFHPAEEALGWKSGAPYDAIITTAGAPKVPDSLVAQLAIEGRMVIPVGSRYDQDLHVIIKHKKNIEDINLGGCRFVSLIGKDAWEE